MYKVREVISEDDDDQIELKKMLKNKKNQNKKLKNVLSVQKKPASTDVKYPHAHTKKTFIHLGHF